MSSPALQQKIAQARKLAPQELPKARLCARVVLAAFEGDDAVQTAVVQLKSSAGNNWSPVTALQFMSGRRGEFAADCADPGEQVELRLAHLLAKKLCSENRLGAVDSLSSHDVAELHSLALAAKAQSAPS